MPVRVRFAPSPTGYLHIGGARTALFNYLFAKKYQGKLILRIEDTDKQRHQEQAVTSLMQALKWLGIEWDEGPYRQTERLAIYKEQAQMLLKNDHAYYCFLTDEELAKEKEKTKSFQIQSPYRETSHQQAETWIQEGRQACIRFKNKKDTEYVIEDIVRGKIKISSKTLGDFIILRSDGMPVYNFSCAVDDALMKISHVFRGEEHLSNSVKQIAIHQALGFEPPQFGHLSIILGKDKKKLSKREGAQAVEYFKDQGYLPEALINFLALLGWNPGTEQEYFKKDELVQAFSEKGLNAAPAVFDDEKLLWLNSEHIKYLDFPQIWKELEPFLNQNKLTFKEDKNWQKQIIANLKPGFKTFYQAVDIIKPLSDQGFQLSKEADEVMSWPESLDFIKRWKNELENYKGPYLTIDDFKKIKTSIQNSLTGKKFFMPLRCALVGRPQGVEVPVLVTLLSLNELKNRAHLLLKNYE